MKHLISLSLFSLALLALLQGGCGDDPVDLPDGGNENEVITTVILTFTPAEGGDSVVATFDDPDGDGGDGPTIDPITLERDTTYNLAVGFENRLEDPTEIITEEVSDESDVHQLFFTGPSVNGPASEQLDSFLTQAYSDSDVNDLPIGLENTIEVTGSGSAPFQVTLRHMPEENGEAVKVEGVAETVKNDGFAGIGGSTDVQVSFVVTVADIEG